MGLAFLMTHSPTDTATVTLPLLCCSGGLSLVSGISWDKVNIKQTDHPAAPPELQGGVLKAQEPMGNAAGLRFSGH